MKNIINEISKGKNLDDNLNKYATNFKAINNKNASVRLAMNYFTLYQMNDEMDEEFMPDGAIALARVNEVIEKIYTDDDFDAAEGIKSIDGIRENIIDKMKALTCYVDMFNVYEYVINRVEYRFKSGTFLDNYSDEDFTREIMQYILNDEDSVVINTKISQIIGQLPIRMTKNKFYEMVNTGLNVYKGSQKQAVLDFIYRINTTAMLEKAENMEEFYPELEKTFESLKEVDFKNLDEETFFSVRNQLDIVSEYIENIMNSNLMIQELINDLLIILYTMKEKCDDNITDACYLIVREVNALFMKRESDKTEQEIEDMFVLLEGVQEDLYQKITVYDIVEQILENNSKDIEKLGLKEQYDIIAKLPKLNSDSLFAEMDAKIQTEEADEKFITSVSEDLIKKFSEEFSKNARVINRAVMSLVLAELPVFFNNISELQDYIYNALNAGNDRAEKMACVEIIKSIMEE